MKYYFGTALLAIAVSACSYDVRLNERLVYSPAPLLSVEKITDAALRNCLQQAIQDQQARQITQLTQLSCSNAGIQSLQGLERFSAISALNLKNNQLSDLLPIASLSTLQLLHIDDNKVQTLTPLGLLDSIEELTVSGNPELQCDSLQRLREVFPKASITAPAHCR